MVDEEAVIFLSSKFSARKNAKVHRAWVQRLGVLNQLRTFVLERSFPWAPLRLSSLALVVLPSMIFILITVAVLKRLLDPDKYPLPWRSYCTLAPEFPPADLALESIPPVGLFIGVMSTAAGHQRRQLIRSTWASHPKSRGGADGKSGLEATSRTVVRFIVGAPTPSLERKLRLENQQYGDMVVLPVRENMNYGKTHAYFSWAYENALVPPPSYPVLNHTASEAPCQDPAVGFSGLDWVRPDYVIKADDDSFVMLAELEARLGVEHYKARAESSRDPLIYWGYLIKDYFMGGQLYALSWSLVEYAATSKVVRKMTWGPEDRQVAKWIRAHPHASSVRWVSERCWIYNHPKSGTVYAHGFLFPSEVQRVKSSIAHGRTQGEIQAMGLPTSWRVDSPEHSWSSVTGPVPRYSLLRSHAKLTTAMEVEALVEGSALSWELVPKRRQPGGTTPVISSSWQRIQQAYNDRETPDKRYLGRNLGGTVVVHYLKKDEWFLETSLALLGL